jgi:hypothetical protein
MPATLGLSTRARSDLMTTQTLGEKAKEMLMEKRRRVSFWVGF